MRTGMLSLLYSVKLKEFQERLGEMTNTSIVYVSDLVSCSNKRVLRALYPLLTFNMEPQTLLGDLVHKGLQHLVTTVDKQDNVEWQAEVPIERTYVIDGKSYILKGRADLVGYEEGSPKFIVEIKTARHFHSTMPLEHHILQLKIYLELFNVDKGILIYVTPEKIAEYSVVRGGIDIEKLLRETISNTVHPRYEWECKYCPFRKLCPYALELQQG
ncbi:MAG: CRISPR-associated protein Cas4 [Pyrodictiaceae archaeon]